MRRAAGVLLLCAKRLSAGASGSEGTLAAHAQSGLDARRLGALPTATGAVSRLAYAHARSSGIGLAPLLTAAGLTARKVEDRDARLGVHQQIKFLNLVAHAVADPLFGFHLAHVPDLREL